jgi:hypothetical protein
MDEKTKKAVEMIMNGFSTAEIASKLMISTTTIRAKIKREIGKDEYRKIVNRNISNSRIRNGAILKKTSGGWSPYAEKDALDRQWEATRHLSGKFYLGFFVRGLE